MKTPSAPLRARTMGGRICLGLKPQAVFLRCFAERFAIFLERRDDAIVGKIACVVAELNIISVGAFV